MFKKLKDNWNIYYAMAIGNLGVAYVMLFKDDNLEHSLIMFAVTGILLGVADILNKLKDNHGTN